MPKQITKYKIFVASPSDLEEDRESIDEVITELNITYGSWFDLTIELLKWETHSAPGVSENHVQNLINKDIRNYDLFIGLMWLKFGTPTRVAGSGTEEEFLKAYQKFIDNPNSLQILFYFKDTPPPSLKDIIPEELNRINNFKKKIGKIGVLYWDYKSIKELQGYLRIHIPKRINYLREVEPIEVEPIKEQEIEVVNNASILEPSDLGFLDYIEAYEIAIDTSNISLNKMLIDTKWIGNKINENQLFHPKTRHLEIF